MTGPVCSTAGCGQPAVLAWQRAGSEDEARHAGLVLAANLAAGVDTAHAQAAIQLAELTARRQQMIDVGTATANVLAVLDQQTQAAQQVLDTLPPAPAAPEPPAPITVAVFGCTVHALTADQATLLHQPDCGCTPAVTAP